MGLKTLPAISMTSLMAPLASEAEKTCLLVLSNMLLSARSSPDPYCSAAQLAIALHADWLASSQVVSLLVREKSNCFPAVASVLFGAAVVLAGRDATVGFDPSAPFVGQGSGGCSWPFPSSVPLLRSLLCLPVLVLGVVLVSRCRPGVGHLSILSLLPGVVGAVVVVLVVAGSGPLVPLAVLGSGRGVRSVSTSVSALPPSSAPSSVPSFM